MRFDLKKDLKEQKNNALSTIRTMSATAHNSIEEETGLGLEYTSYMHDTSPEVMDARKRHIAILNVRKGAIIDINLAKTPAEIKNIVSNLKFV